MSADRIQDLLGTCFVGDIGRGQVAHQTAIRVYRPTPTMIRVDNYAPRVIRL